MSSTETMKSYIILIDMVMSDDEQNKVKQRNVHPNNASIDFLNEPIMLESKIQREKLIVYYVNK